MTHNRGKIDIFTALRYLVTYEDPESPKTYNVVVLKDGEVEKIARRVVELLREEK